jgi:hypothetical protein
MKFIVAPCPALKEFEYEEPTRADTLSEPGRITSQIIKLLIDADLVIADLTQNNPNVYYELSLRHAIGNPVIHMALEGTPLSFDVRDNRTIFYTMHARSVENAKNELSNQVRRVHQGEYKAMNPILETVSIINLERSTDPSQKVLGQLMSMVERVSGDLQSLRRDFQTSNMGRWGTFPDMGRWGTPPTLRGVEGFGALGSLIDSGAATFPAGPITTNTEMKHTKSDPNKT